MYHLGRAMESAPESVKNRVASSSGDGTPDASSGDGDMREGGSAGEKGGKWLRILTTCRHLGM